ncbi:MAG: tetratricopeptide repeat protein [Sphingopyxis sp.]
MNRLILFITAAAVATVPVAASSQNGGAATATSGAASTAASTAATTAASATDVTRRVDRIERELRAVQRRVFPGSAEGVFQPELSPNAVTATTGTSAATPVADLTARVDALESQLTRLTEQVEQTGFRQREMDSALARLRADMTARITRLEGADGTASGNSAGATPIAATPAPSTARTAATPAPTTPAPSATRPAAASTGATRPVSTAAATRPATASPPATATTTAERRARVAALEVPATGNAAEDAYLFGYRLWDARLYPEAQAQLQRVVETYGSHRRASYAGNLLGRAYLDNDQPTLALRALYDNYRNRPRGERAPDSVYYMGLALIRLDRKPDACRTFDEFDRVYGATASDTLKRQVATARGTAGC